MNNSDIMKQPDVFKIIRFKDIVSHCKKYTKPLDYALLKKHGYSDDEINWLELSKQEDFRHIELLVATKKNNQRIKELLEENKQLKKLLSEKPISKKQKSFLFKETVDEWIVTANSNNKHPSIHYISKRNISILRDILYLLRNDKNETTYHSVVSVLKEKHNLPITIDEFNGGKYRGKYYFPLYYYPLKILEHLGEISHKSKIIKIK